VGVVVDCGGRGWWEEVTVGAEEVSRARTGPLLQTALVASPAPLRASSLWESEVEARYLGALRQGVREAVISRLCSLHHLTLAPLDRSVWKAGQG